MNIFVSYLVASDNIKITHSNDINVWGMASPDIDINQVNVIKINQSDGGSSTGSYIITEWNVQY